MVAPAMLVVPAAHAVQLVAPGELLNIPAEHGMHCAFSLYVPAGHSESHEAAPDALNVPGEQEVHIVDDPVPYFPAEQLTQDFAVPVVGNSDVPAGQEETQVSQSGPVS